ncbi:hypothetical protein [Nocardioides sp. AX2bis]|uniref:hypothetical protein n=1 Tax=Nocardioides sp. AX2bis TaxID=2653157 RepID=UPI001915D222|nr:hypothetical protein [Nocardioides sp. AX2bis]
MPGERGCAVLLPGRAYDVSAPLLARAGQVLAAEGWEVRRLAWDGPAPLPGEVDPGVAEDFVVRHLRAATADLQPGRAGAVLVVAKSLGTRAAANAASRGWSAAWLTPLLDDASCRAGIAANPAPQLLVGGTADAYWDAAVAAGLGRAASVEVLEVEAADHGLALPGEAAVSAAVLDRVGEALAALARQVGVTP